MGNLFGREVKDSGPQQWETYLFRNYKIVALHPLNSKVGLFDVLVKKEEMGKYPVLFKICSIGSLQSEASDITQETKKIKLFRAGQLPQEDESGLIERDEECNFEFSMDLASDMLIYLLKTLKMWGGVSKERTLKGENLKTEAIDSELKVALFSDGGRWVPNLEKIKKLRPLLCKNGNIELWIVTDMLYCTDMMVIESASEGSAGAGGTLPDIATSSNAAPIHAEVRIHKSKTISSINTGCKVALGFRAIRLEYYPDGKLKDIDMKGGAQPVYRANDDGKADALNPYTHPDHHMAGFFVVEGKEPVACLKIQ